KLLSDLNSSYSPPVIDAIVLGIFFFMDSTAMIIPASRFIGLAELLGGPRKSSSTSDRPGEKARVYITVLLFPTVVATSLKFTERTAASLHSDDQGDRLGIQNFVQHNRLFDAIIRDDEIVGTEPIDRLASCVFDQCRREHNRRLSSNNRFLGGDASVQ